MDKINNILQEAGRTAEDKELERQFKIACKKLGINPKETLQNYMKQVIEESKEKDRKMQAIQFHQQKCQAPVKMELDKNHLLF